MKKLKEEDVLRNGVYIQGDVVFTAAPKGMEAIEKVTTGIIAEGEATGHAHRVNPKLCEVAKTPVPAVLWLRNLGVDVPVKVDHEEHHALELPGDQISWVQEEYDEIEGLRKVAD